MRWMVIGIVILSELNGSGFAEEGWSQPSNGLQGRLVRYSIPSLNSTEIIGIRIELMNVSSEPLGIENNPASLKLELSDTEGKPVEGPGSFTRSGPVPLPQWGVLPRGCYLGYSLYDYGIGVPKDQAALLPLLEGKSWLLKPGTYSLQGTFTVTKSHILPENAWVGVLRLPPLKIVVESRVEN